MDEMRKAFEAWAQEYGWDISKIGSGEGWDGTYTNATVHFMWEAWKAACIVEREEIVAMAYEMEMETTEYCMNVYEEGEKYKCDLIDAISARNQQ